MTTSTIAGVYTQVAPKPLFLSGFFKAPPQNHFNTESVELDIERDSQQVAAVVQSLGSDYNKNETGEFTNKKFTPPVYKEGFSLNAFDLLKREAGQSGFNTPSEQIRGNLITRFIKGARKVEAKILRGIELQASQILQTGNLLLKDQEGKDAFKIDYKPKATHFVNVANVWTGANADPMKDLESLSEVIQTDGLVIPDIIIMGASALAAAKGNEKFIKNFDSRNISGNILADMQITARGGIYQGTLRVGNAVCELYTYGVGYQASASAVATPFLNTNKVLMLSSESQLDALFGAVPNIADILGVSLREQLLPELPTRFDSNSTDLFTNVYLSASGEQLMGGVASRPILVPTAIDSFGCLTVA